MTVISVENIWKQYRYGTLSHATLHKDLQSWWARIRGNPDPNLPIDHEHRAKRTASNHMPADDRFWALRNISFEVKRGEVLGIIGRNGAGKSTLLKIMSRVTTPTMGEIKIKGRVASLLEVGTGFHPELTGRENIYLNGAILGMTKEEIKRKFDEIVAFAEIEKFIDTPVKRYSSGMYVRLAFAVAAHLEPEILVVDEVLAVGDAQFQKKCLGKMGDVAKEGRTVLFVSHNMVAVTLLCQSVLWLNKGSIVLSGESQKVVEQYLGDNSGQVSAREWTYPGNSPGDDYVRLLSIRVIQNEHVASFVDINLPSYIEMVFEVLKERGNLIPTIRLFNVEGFCLFESCDWRPNDYKPGTYRVTVELPPQLLSETKLSVNAYFVFYDPYILCVDAPETISFTTVDSDNPDSVRGSYTGHWPGLLRPRLNWSQAITVDSRCDDINSAGKAFNTEKTAG